MYRVLISDPLPAEGLEILRKTPSIELDERAGLKGDELRAALAENDGVIIRSGTTLTPDLLRGQSRLKVIVRAGVGVDNIDLESATREGIVVMNTPGGNTLSTAEHTIALLLSLCRHVPAADAKLRAGKWDRKSFVGTQLAGKTIGVVGLGRVGLAVAKRCLGLEMKVLGYDPFMSPEKASQMGIEPVANVEDIFPRVDFVTVHVPLSDETRGLVGASQIAKMPKGGCVINCARGGIVDETALYEALKSGHLAGAALDVFVNEPETNSPLFELNNVVVTPHLGASTNEAQLNVAVEAAELISDYFATGNVRFAVNMASLDPKELKDVRLHLDVAYRLGVLQAQLAKGSIKKVTLVYQGEAAKKNTKLMTGAYAMGLLSGALEEEVNLVNVQMLASERGIQFVEQTSSEHSDFATQIRAELETEGETIVTAGTTRGNNYCRLIRYGQYRLDSYMDGIILFYVHKDVPGIIGLAGTVLGKHNVNIAQMTVGRHEPGGDAIGVLALDSTPSEEALAELRKDPRITSVQLVHLPEFGKLPRCFS